MLLRLRNLISILVLFASVVAKADILFIDFNLSEKEIAAAQRVADARGEKLVVFPEVSTKIRQYFDEVEKYKNDTINRIKKCNTDEACILKNVDYYTQALNQQNEAVSGVDFGAEALGSFLHQMDQQGRAFTAFIISGHAGATQFSGVFSKTITHEDLAKTVEGRTSLSSVRTVLYWGCYTMSLGAVKLRWPKVFPKAHLVAGFDQVGPSGERLESASLLEQTLTNEQSAISTGNNLSALKVVFKKFQYSKDTNFALSVDYNTYVSNHNTLYMADSGKTCSADKYIASTKVIDCFDSAQSPECANPPANTGSGEIRQAYTVIQSMEHCFDEQFIDKTYHRYPDFVLRLNFFDNAKKNFAKFHKNDLANFDRALEVAQVPSSLFLSNVANMSRGEIQKRIQALEAQAPQFDDKLKAAIAAVRFSLINLSPLVIPQSWIEPDAREGVSLSDEFKM